VEDFHSVRKITTGSGSVRFDVSRTETAGHADRFWAAALANHAAGNAPSGPLEILTRARRETSQKLEHYSAKINTSQY